VKLVVTQGMASYPHVQYNRKKTMLDIELDENLRRKRNELEGMLETLDDVPLGDASDAASMEARARELKALQASVERLSNELQGQSSRAL
jgi:structural maintenance of chromosome 3 (chondroitin sulfate proteoglycan 6)